MKILSDWHDPVEINSNDDWLGYAPPEGGLKQWVDGRSAKETAKAWIGSNGPRVPDDLVRLLESHPKFRGFECERVTPEKETRFDRIPGKGRQHDLLVRGEVAGGRIIIGIEAKSDESFDLTLGNKLSAIDNPRSQQPKRMNQLCLAVLGVPYSPVLDDVHYQLLHAPAATVVDAHENQADLALFLVHEFVTDQTDDLKHQSNATDLNRFVARFTKGDATELPAGRIIGPFHLPGNEHIPSHIPLYLGKISTNLRSG